MNERFEELKIRAVREADTSHIDFDNMSHNEIQMLGDIAVEQKFAELIVQECAKLQHKNVVVGGVSEYNKGRRTLAEDILKHFGVEE